MLPIGLYKHSSYFIAHDGLCIADDNTTYSELGQNEPRSANLHKILRVSVTKNAG